MDAWTFLPLGYAASILIETPILLIGLASRHSLGARLFAGAWLTACSYPIVILVLPPLFEDRRAYLVVAETFAPLAECVLFVIAFGGRTWKSDCVVVTLANLASFLIGEWLL